LIASPDGVLLRVKVVPGASRSKVVGMLGDRLKVAVAAPPEGGKANQAVCELLAEAFGAAKRDVEVAEGHTRPQKMILLRGVNLCAAAERLTKMIE
jgi:uncharacterized protein (TIGR00251 family)